MANTFSINAVRIPTNKHSFIINCLFPLVSDSRRRALPPLSHKCTTLPTILCTLQPQTWEDPHPSPVSRENLHLPRKSLLPACTCHPFPLKLSLDLHDANPKSSTFFLTRNTSMKLLLHQDARQITAYSHSHILKLVAYDPFNVITRYCNVS